MTKKSSYQKLLLFVLFCFALTGLDLYAQPTGPYEDAVILANSTYQSVSYKHNSGNGFIIVESPENGTVNRIRNNTHTYVKYTPNDDFTGVDEFKAELTIGPSYDRSIYYITFRMLVKESILVPNDDYFVFEQGSGPHTLEVLANDSSTSNDIFISELPASGIGEFSIAGNNIDFTPDPDFAGKTYVAYLACDSLGECAVGIATINIIDSNSEPLSDTIQLFTIEDQSVDGLLPGGGFEVIQSPTLGSVDLANDGKTFQYSPVQGVNGSDEFLLASDDFERLIRVEILEGPQQNTFVIDDYVYTPVDHTVTFNVQDNDLNDNFDLDSYSIPTQGNLTYEGDNTFTFTPSSGFEGYVRFTYTTCAFNNCETGDVYVFVGDLNPNGPYNLRTVKNRPLIINYDVPITNFDFQLWLVPDHGDLYVLDGQDTVSFGCETTSGYNLVVYEPHQDYVGSDEFELRYCAGDSNNCQVVKVAMQILDLDVDTVCTCTEDCVWPGDANGSGRVDMIDLLDLGYDIGSSGPARPFVEMDQWIGQYCESWPSGATGITGTNQKHLDTDGDGMVMDIDTHAISKFYNRVHTFVAEKNYVLKDYPISLRLTDTVYEIGDLVTAEIVVGNSSNPAYFVNGISLSYNFSPEVVDTSTITGELYSDSWMTAGTFPLGLIKQSGRDIDLGLTRTGNDPISGIGAIGKVEFIIDDEITGFRPGGRYIQCDIKLAEAHVKVISGQIYRLPTNTTRIWIDLYPDEDSGEDTGTDALTVFPNPGPGHFILDMNDGSALEMVQVYDMNGRLILDNDIQSGQSWYDLRLENVQEGVYILRVTSSKGTETRKLSVIKP